MPTSPSAEAPPRCKCCGAASRPLGAVDAARSCEDRRAGPVFAPAGHAIRYHRCDACGFVFTVDFDAMSAEELGEAIYNADYVRADPDFEEARPAYFAAALGATLALLRADLRALDFGGGRGLFARMMRERGFRYDSHDPYFDSAARPAATYDLVTAMEVVEHSRDPHATFAAATEALAPGGVLFFTTALWPPDAGLDWWYLAPRNGHVSLHTRGSLHACADRLGMRHLALTEGEHLFLPRTPGPVGRRILRLLAPSAIYTASVRGLGELARVAALAARAGAISAALHPRAWARALRQSGQAGRSHPAPEARTRPS